GAFVGRVTTSWTGTTQAVSGATVTISGVTAVVNGQPFIPSPLPSVVTDSSGCFAVVLHPGDAAPTAPAGSGCENDSSIPTVAMRLITSTATLTVTQATAKTLTTTRTNLGTGAFVALDLIQAPKAISGSLTLDPATASDFSQASIQVTQQPSGSGIVHVTAVPTSPASQTASLTWTDTNADQP